LNSATSDFAWSPDGRQIAYLEFGFPEPRALLYVVNTDGTGKRWLTRPLAVDVGGPSWSPDGRVLAFTGVGGIYTVHADGTGLRKLTGSPGRSNYGPNWSPDGRQIAFISDRDDPAHRAFDVFVMNADGSGQRNLTHTRTSRNTPRPGLPAREAARQAAAATVEHAA
jgi:TolB protein